MDIAKQNINLVDLAALISKSHFFVSTFLCNYLFSSEIIRQSKKPPGRTREVSNKTSRCFQMKNKNTIH